MATGTSPDSVDGYVASLRAARGSSRKTHTSGGGR